MTIDTGLTSDHIACPSALFNGYTEKCDILEVHFCG